MKSTHSSPHTTHREVWTLLPWYINGTLADAELDLVKQHLRICITCRRELAVQQRISETIRNPSSMNLAPQTSFLRLMKRIDREGRQVNSRKRWWNSARTHCAGLAYRLSAIPVPWRTWIALPLLLLFIGLLTPLARLWLAPMSREPQYHTLADPHSVPAAGRNDIRIVFAEMMVEEQIQQLLLPVHGQIVEGPSAIGAYTIRIDAGDHADEVLSALDWLRHHPRVLFAELARPVATPNSGTDSLQ